MGLGLWKFCSGSGTLLSLTLCWLWKFFADTAWILLEELLGCLRGAGNDGVRTVVEEMRGQEQSEPVRTVNVSKAVWAAGRITLYLPGRADTVITKVVLPGLGSPIALRVCRPLRFPQKRETQVHSL